MRGREIPSIWHRCTGSTGRSYSARETRLGLENVRGEGDPGQQVLATTSPPAVGGASIHIPGFDLLVCAGRMSAPRPGALC